MVLRLWTEDGGGLRVRITTAPQVGSREEVTTYAASPAEVLAAVGAWLETAVTPR